MTNDSKETGSGDPSCYQTIDDMKAMNQKLESLNVENKKEWIDRSRTSNVDEYVELYDVGNSCGLVALPAHVLQHIGQTVLELCGVKSFIYLTRTSKYIHRIMMEKAFLSSTIESNNEWIYRCLESENHNYFKHVLSSTTITLSNKKIASILRQYFKKSVPCCRQPILSVLYGLNGRSSKSFINVNPSVTTASNLEELALCRTVVEEKKSIGFTIHPDHRYTHRRTYKRQLHFIADVMMKHRSAKLLLDLHGDRLSLNSQFGRDLKKILAKKIEYNYPGQLIGRIRIRRRGHLFRSEMQDTFDRHPVFVEFGFWLGGIVVPPLRSSDREIMMETFCVFDYDHSEFLQDLYKMFQNGVTLPPGTKKLIFRTFNVGKRTQHSFSRRNEA